MSKKKKKTARKKTGHSQAGDSKQEVVTVTAKLLQIVFFSFNL